MKQKMNLRQELDLTRDGTAEMTRWCIIIALHHSGRENGNEGRLYSALVCARRAFEAECSTAAAAGRDAGRRGTDHRGRCRV